jgi:hypothetical protein
MDGAKLVFEVVYEGAGPDVDQRGRGVNLLKSVETTTIEADAAEDRDRATADTTAPTSCGDRHAGLVTASQHGGDFGGVSGPGDNPGSGRHGTRQGPSE